MTLKIEIDIVKKLSLEKEVNVNASEFTLRDGLCVLDMISNGAVIDVKYDDGYSVFVDFRIDAEGVHIDTKGFKKGEHEFKEFEPDGWTEKNDMHYCKECSEEEDEPPSQDEIREDLALNIDF